jgi:serine/threonine protein kinase
VTTTGKRANGQQITTRGSDELRQELNPTWAVRLVALSQHLGQPTLVLEDPGGETLDRFLQGPMEVMQFLRFATGLTTALGALHKNGSIHKDVKPTNVLVHRTTGQVRHATSFRRSSGTMHSNTRRPRAMTCRNPELHGARVRVSPGSARDRLKEAAASLSPALASSLVFHASARHRSMRRQPAVDPSCKHK